MNDLILNQVAIWRGCGAKKLNIKKVAPGRRYRNPGSPVFATTDKVGYRYAKDYSVDKVIFCLMVFTTIDSKNSIEKQLDQAAKSVTKEQALKISAGATPTNFEYLAAIVKEEI